MTKLKHIPIAIISILCVLVTILPVSGAAFTYAARTKTIKVCNLLIPSACLEPEKIGTPLENWYSSIPENSDPHVWYILDSLPWKPPGWEFINPLAPKTVNQEIYDRWRGRYEKSGRNIATMHPEFKRDAPITKNMGCYWEVVLSEKTLPDLPKFDLIFITNHHTWTFTPKERDLLAKATDAGAQIWLDDCSGLRIGEYPPGSGTSSFFLDLQFHNDGPGGSAAVVDRFHPLLTTPHWLTHTEISDEINELGDKGPINNYYMTNLAGTGPPDPAILQPIVNNNRGTPTDPTDDLPYIAAGRFGSGFIVTTSRDIGCSINDPCGGIRTEPAGENSGLYSGERIWRAKPQDCKFVINMVNWSFTWAGYRRDSYHNAASGEELKAPLLPKWQFTTAGPVISSPCIYKNVIFVGSDDGFVYAFDADPIEDLDGDGDPDDGFDDDSAPGLSTPYDIIWGYQSGSFVRSSPTVASIYLGPAIGTREIVFVGANNGSLYALYAFPDADNNGLIDPLPQLLWSQNLGGAITSSPTVVRGIVYVGVDTAAGGAVYALEASSGQILGNYPGTTHPAMGAISQSSPAVSLFIDQTTGTIDDTIYIGSQDGKFYAIVFHTKNERLVPDTTYTTYTGRFKPWTDPNHNWVDGLPFTEPAYSMVTPVIRKNGSVLRPSDYTIDFTNGTVSFVLGFNTANDIITADYYNPGAAKWWTDTNGDYQQDNGEERPFEVPGFLLPIQSSPLITAEDYIYFGTDATPPATGRVYAIRDAGNRPVFDPTRDSGTWLFTPSIVSSISTSPVKYNDLLIVAASHPSVPPTGSLWAIRTKPDPYTGALPPTVVWRYGYIDAYLGTPDTTSPYLLGPISSSPIVVGDTLYVCDANGNLFAFEADPRGQLAVDTSTTPYTYVYDYRGDDGEIKDQPWVEKKPPDDLTTDPTRYADLLQVKNLPGLVMFASPAAATAMFVQGSTSGIHVLSSPVTLIADNYRLLEVDTASNALWTVESTYIRQNPMLIASPIISTPFNRPATVKKVSFTNYLIADTGNNRVVEIDKIGNIVWQIANLSDADQTQPANAFFDFDDLDSDGDIFPRLLSAGELPFLKEPTDATRFWAYGPIWVPGVGYGPAPAYNYQWYTLIVDSGNHRILIVDDYKNLVWCTQTQGFGKKYQYLSAEPIVEFNGTHWVFTGVLCVVGNYRLAADLSATPPRPLIEQGPGGSIVRITGSIYDPLNPANTGKGIITWAINTIPFNNLLFPNYPPLQIANPTQLIATSPTCILVDSSGIYEIDITDPTNWRITWKFSNLDYQTVVNNKLTTLYGAYGTGWVWLNNRPPLLLPVCAQRIPSNQHTIIVNRNYANSAIIVDPLGTPQTISYPNSEIIEVRTFDDTNNLILNYNNEIPIWRCPPLGTIASEPQLLKQPTYVQRLQ